MKQFVALHFLPGAAGNFLSRCINLLDNTYVWSKNEKLPQTLDEKYNVLTYKTANPTDWLEFENKVEPYHKYRPHWDIDSDGIAVYPCHPTSVDFIKTRVGISDSAVNVYIDPTNNLDWCILNGWSKQSFQTNDWFLAADLLEQDSSVYNIDLSDMINGYKRFLPEFTKLATFLNRTVTEDIEIILHKLYDEWYATTLKGPALERERARISRIFKNISDDFEKNNRQ